LPATELEQLLNEIRNRSDAGADSYEAGHWLARRLRSLDHEQQGRYLESLLEELLRERYAYGITLFLLEGIDDPSALDTISHLLLPLPDLQSDDEEAHLADLIRVLSAAGNANLMAPVRRYLLERRIGPHWSTVPWALWPCWKELFSQAWMRFFTEQDPAEWKDSLVIKSFLGEPEAIRRLRAQLAHQSEERWNQLREALLKQAGSAGWFGEEERSELDNSLK